MTEKKTLLKRADDVWNDPTYDDLLDLVSDLIKYIEKGDK